MGLTEVGTFAVGLQRERRERRGGGDEGYWGTTFYS